MNMKNKGVKLGVLLVAMLLLSMAFVPAVSAQGANESKGINPVESSTGNRKTFRKRWQRRRGHLEEYEDDY